MATIYMVIRPRTEMFMKCDSPLVLRPGLEMISVASLIAFISKRICRAPQTKRSTSSRFRAPLPCRTEESQLELIEPTKTSRSLPMTAQPCEAAESRPDVDRRANRAVLHSTWTPALSTLSSRPPMQQPLVPYASHG